MAVSTTRVVILSALAEEQSAFKSYLVDGHWQGVQVYFALTGVGKPAAAAVTQREIERHRPDAIIFTGVAGSLDPRRKIGDIGIGVAAIDADLDIRAWFPQARRGEHPFTGQRTFVSHPELVEAAQKTPQSGLFRAYIATGSAFLDAPGKARFRAEVLPDLATQVDGVDRIPDLIEMEGSAVFQTAHANGIPALALRAVSDAVEGDAVADFHAFVASSAARCAAVIDHVLARLAQISHVPLQTPTRTP